MQKVPPVEFLSGTRLYLRPVEESDLARCQRWINDPEVRAFLLAVFPMDEVTEQRWHEARDRKPMPNDIMLAIVVREGNVHIGNMGLHHIDWLNRVAVTGSMIGEKSYWGKGYAHEAKTLLLKYAFDTLQLHRVESRVLSPNTRSLNCLKKSGYQIEGVHKERFFRDGRWIDEVSLAIMADDWRRLQKGQ